MNKVLVPIILLSVTVLALCALLSPNLGRYFTSQAGAVIGIDLNGTLQWQSQKGLNKDLILGDRVSDVRLLQQALNTASPKASTSVDGSFGTKTAQAVVVFQKENDLETNGWFDPDTRAEINKIFFNELCPEGRGSIFEDELLVHVSKEYSLPADYIPADLVDLSKSIKTTSIICAKKEVETHIKDMFDNAAKEGIYLGATSGFRKPEVQSAILKALLAVKGEKAYDRVAEPLHSEHQLGTTFDLTGKSIGYVSASDRFTGTREELWLRTNAYRYGFVQSYPKDKTAITGYDYESWHYRFMGQEIAQEIFDKQISVEEYFDSLQ